MGQVQAWQAPGTRQREGRTLQKAAEVGVGPPQRQSPALTLAVPVGLSQHREPGPHPDGAFSQRKTREGGERPVLLGAPAVAWDWEDPGAWLEASGSLRAGVCKGASRLSAETGGLAACVGAFPGPTGS